MKLYVIRHGETVWNTEARLQGKSDIPLNEKGVALARITGQAMSDVPFDIVYSSPLSRALKTAECIVEGRDIPIITDERIAEISFGIWEGLSCHRDHYEIPSDSFQDFFQDPFQFQPPEGGESLTEVCERTESFMNELLERDGESDITVLISCHGCTLRALMNHFYQSKENFWRGHVPPNCGVSIVNIKDGKAEILAEDKVYYDVSEPVDFYER